MAVPLQFPHTNESPTDSAADEVGTCVYVHVVGIRTAGWKWPLNVLCLDAFQPYVTCVKYSHYVLPATMRDQMCKFTLIDIR